MEKILYNGFGNKHQQGMIYKNTHEEGSLMYGFF